MNSSIDLAGNCLPKRNEDANSRSINACKKFREYGFYLLITCVLLQLIIDSSIKNIIGVIIVFFTALIVFAIIIRASVIRAAPLPALIVIGFNMATMSGALVTQTLYFKPLTYNLLASEHTFTALVLYQIALLAALLFFMSGRVFFRVSNFLRSNIFTPLGLLRAPSPIQVWIMGVFGLVAIIASIDFNHVVKYGDAGPKFIEAFGYLAFAPLILPVLGYIFPNNMQYASIKNHYKYLFVYLIILVVVNISANTRGGFAAPVANLCLIIFLLLLMGQLVITNAVRRWLVAGVAIAALMTPVISDLATAMVVVRGERTQITTTQLLVKTLDAFQNKKEIETYRKLQKENIGTNDYEEDYITNPFLTRLILTKFTDNMFSLTDVRAGRHADVIWEVTEKTLIGLFPTPLLRFFGSDLNKEDLRFSMGDVLYAAQNGFGLGEYKLGSSVAHGVALMGVASFLVIIPMFLIVFIAVQSFTLSTGGWLVVSPLILLQLISLYYLPISDSFFGPVMYLLRTLPQNILIYILVFHASWLIVSAFQLILRPGNKVIRY